MNHQMISRSDESQRTDRNTASLKKEIHLYVHSVPYFFICNKLYDLCEG